VALCGTLGHAQDRFATGPEEVVAERPFMRYERPSFRNFAFEPYTNYPTHTLPFDDTPRALYGPLGDFLLNGYDLYSWKETRVPGQQYGSSIFKPNEMFDLAWNKVYDGLVMGRDGYGDWRYSLIVADNLTAHLSAEKSICSRR